MGVRVSGSKPEKIICRCDHPGCTKVATRQTTVCYYDRRTGTETRRERQPRLPFPYWRKVFSSSKKPFHLFMPDGGMWPGDVRAFCADHHEDFTASVNALQVARNERLNRYF